jgi:hypothetical protein
MISCGGIGVPGSGGLMDDSGMRDPQLGMTRIVEGSTLRISSELLGLPGDTRAMGLQPAFAVFATSAVRVAEALVG